jgi:hypothetical protein
LNAAEQEQSGLSRRVEDVLARAAVTIGDGTDEYLERHALDNHHQDLFSIEISSGERRLRELATAITQFKFLKVAVLSRFPDFVRPASSDYFRTATQRVHHFARQEMVSTVQVRLCRPTKRQWPEWSEEVRDQNDVLRKFAALHLGYGFDLN